jgi:hypothetical protein
MKNASNRLVSLLNDPWRLQCHGCQATELLPEEPSIEQLCCRAGTFLRAHQQCSREGV